MALETLLVKKLPESFTEIDSVVATTDLKILSIHLKCGDLIIFVLNCNDHTLLLENIKTYAWQEDNYSKTDYRLLVINHDNTILYYSIKITVSDEGVPVLSESRLANWKVHNILRYFQELAKNFEDECSIDILKFEAKEAVFLFDKKVVVSFFPACEEDPQIMSVSDLRDDNPSYKKVLLFKDLLFALNEKGTRLYIHSFVNNTKLLEVGFFDSNTKPAETGTVINFMVSLKLDFLIYVTEKQQVHMIPLDISSQLFGKSQSQSVKSITAFAKQFPSVKRLKEGSRRFSTSSATSHPMCFTCEDGGSILKDFILVENKLFFIQENGSDSMIGVHLLHTDQPTTYKKFSDPAHFIKSGSEEVPFPQLLLSENKVFLLLFDIEQDKLVNELMMYPSSEAVKNLSSLNNWMNIQMDIEVLKLGLSNRQLYTVEFFLKTLFEGFSQSWNLPLSSEWHNKIVKECSLWKIILGLVLDNVHKNLTDSYSCQYAEQLLQVAIVMVIQIISVIESKDSVTEFFTPVDKEQFLKIFSEGLVEMRKLLRDNEIGVNERPEPNTALSHSQIYGDKILQHWKKWEKLSHKEVIKDSVVNGTIPMAQSYFSCYCTDNANVAYNEFKTEAENFATDFLRHRKIEDALNIFIGMGININDKLINIFQTTSEKEIRISMVDQLIKRNLLTDLDVESLKFISLLEKIYSCTSFEHARLLLEERSHLIEDVMCAVEETDDSLIVGDCMEYNQDNSESGAYCRLVLNWLNTWDDEIKGRILAPFYLKNSHNLECILKKDGYNDINKLSAWFHLLENGNSSYVLNWIDKWLDINPQKCSIFKMFEDYSVTKLMIDMIPEKSTLYISENILNALAKHGIFCEEEQENIALFLTRMGRAQCNMNELALSKNSTLTFSELCHRIVHYCLKHNLISLLYSTISINYSKFTMWPTCPLCEVPSLKIIIAFYLWSQNHNDISLAYHAVSEITSYLVNQPVMSPTDIFHKVPLPLAFTVQLFNPQPLEETIKEILQGPMDTVTIIKDNFKSFPVLYNHLFKTEQERSLSDITIYECLKDNAVYDTSQLFGWQSSNPLKSEDSYNELPHFSLRSLSEQYGLKKELTYLYYLMEGRPNYSFLKFIAQEIIIENGLSLSRMRSACREVTEYALLNYKSVDICAACITFIELLGQDSLPLRVCLIGANILHDMRSSEEEVDKHFTDISRKFKQAHADKSLALSLVSELENAVLSKWNPFDNDTDALFRDIMLWMPVMAISHLYEVEAGNSYLIECAKQNSWLKFLVFSQIFQIPKDQVLKTASKFSNSCISYHIFHSLHRKSSLLYDIAIESKPSSTVASPTKDMRKSYLSRIGVKKEIASEIMKSIDSEDDKLSVTSEDTSTSSDTDIRAYVLKDLFSQLLLAHGSDVPWDCLLHTSFKIQNPILAALAASYQDAPLETCFFMWLYASLSQNESVRKDLETSFTDLSITECNTNDIENLMIIALRHHKILTLWLATHIFLPTTPLPSLMGFLRSFMVYKKFDSSIETFQNKLWDYPKSSEKSSVLHSLFWIENISVAILKESVICCYSNYERHILLRHFSHTRLEKSFSKEIIVPEFIKVYHMRECLGDSVIDMDIKNLFLPENDLLYKSTCWEAVKKLLDQHLYEEAQVFSEHAHLPQDQMLLLQINQVTDEARSTHFWKNLVYRINFWQDIILKLQVLTLHTAADFLEVQCEISDSYGEKFFLMKTLIDIVRNNSKQGLPDGDIYNLDALNQKMWWFCIKAEVNHELLPEIFNVKPVLKFDIHEAFFTLKIPIKPCCIEEDKEKEALGCIIGKFLSKGDIHNAFHLASTFGYDYSDLQIIKMCFELATGESDTSSVNFSVSSLSTTDVPSFRIIQSLIHWAHTGKNNFTSDQKTTMQSMESLSKKCLIAIKICHQILVHYIISVVLDQSYVTVAQENAFITLKNILVRKLEDNYLLAKSLITVMELSDSEVAKFLSKEIWTSLKTLRSSDLVMIPEEKSAFSEQVIYDPLRANERFQLIVKLCQDPSVLGNALMSIISSESHELNVKSTDEHFFILVDLCVSAHECFATACNMDGISQILQTAQVLVSMLEEAEKFHIMVQLLTGLGRYSEMMYVFDVLKSHDKFNILFEKKMQNMPDLRLALLDYLKKYPPSDGDNYFYTLAKEFGMYREKAEILEMSVQKQLSQLCKRNTALDNDMKEELENALNALSEAAKSYCKAECLHQAQNCTRLAQLVALQIYFVPSGVWIIGLDASSVARFITDHDKFSQSYIVAEEYRNHHLWSQALLHNVVIRGDREYLREFRSHFGLPASLITDIVKRYTKLPNKAESTIRNMKLLLSLCSNIKAKYTLAHELGFSDIISELLMGEGSSYLQDLITNNVIK